MAQKVVSELVLYENDALLMLYTDGTGVELAPCASTFIYHHARDTQQHPLHGHEIIQQRCEFVTSSFKPSVRQAIEFRNKYATRPYLCRELLDSATIQTLHADVCDIAWPACLRHAKYVIHSDGSVSLDSLCESATFVLGPSRQQFTVQFLCHTSRHRNRDTSQARPKQGREIAKDTNMSSDDRIPNLLQYCIKSKGTVNTSVNNESWQYATVTNCHSVHECPETWSHALKLALEVAQSQRTVTFLSQDNLLNTSQTEVQNGHQLTSESEVDKRHKTDDTVALDCDNEVKDNNNYGCRDIKCIYSSVPKALWLNCLGSHLHKWCNNDLWNNEEKFAESAIVNGRIKVLCLRGVIYRFLWTHPRTIEIYPGDGSTLRSTGLSGHFFTHYYNYCGKIEENMYSIDRPPPDVPGAAYSISRLIRTAARFLRHLYEDGITGSVNCCWKHEASERQIQPALPTVLLEECSVAGVGRFTAYSSGRVRVVYSDRTALNMWADFSKRLGHCKQHSHVDIQQMPDVHTYQRKSSKTRHVVSDLPEGVARLMLPNGHYEHVILSQPAQYSKYVKAAMEWVSWVNSSPEERHKFYKDTLHDPVKASEVDTELRKINCFNYIVEKTLLNDFEREKPDNQASSRPNIRTIATDGRLCSNKSENESAVVCVTHARELLDHTSQTRDSFEVPSSYFSCTRASNVTKASDFGAEWNSVTESRPLNNVPSSASLACDNNMSHDHISRDYDLPRDTFVDFDLVQQVLRKTSQTVQDIDAYLQSKTGNVTQ